MRVLKNLEIPGKEGQSGVFFKYCIVSVHEKTLKIDDKTNLNRSFTLNLEHNFPIMPFFEAESQVIRFVQNNLFLDHNILKIKSKNSKCL